MDAPIALNGSPKCSEPWPRSLPRPRRLLPCSSTPSICRSRRSRPGRPGVKHSRGNGGPSSDRSRARARPTRSRSSRKTAATASSGSSSAMNPSAACPSKATCSGRRTGSRPPGRGRPPLDGRLHHPPACRARGTERQARRPAPGPPRICGLLPALLPLAVRPARSGWPRPSTGSTAAIPESPAWPRCSSTPARGRYPRDPARRKPRPPRRLRPFPRGQGGALPRGLRRPGPRHGLERGRDRPHLFQLGCPLVPWRGDSPSRLRARPWPGARPGRSPRLPSDRWRLGRRRRELALHRRRPPRLGPRSVRPRRSACSTITRDMPSPPARSRSPASGSTGSSALADRSAAPDARSDRVPIGTATAGRPRSRTRSTDLRYVAASRSSGRSTIVVVTRTVAVRRRRAGLAARSPSGNDRSRRSSRP